MKFKKNSFFFYSDGWCYSKWLANITQKVVTKIYNLSWDNCKHIWTLVYLNWLDEQQNMAIIEDAQAEPFPP